MTTTKYLLLALFGLGLVLNFASVDAQGPSISVCTPLDLVAIVDQSNSHEYTDPENLRLDAIRNLIDVLWDNAALRCPGTTHRFGAVAFGNDAWVMVPMQEIQVVDVDSDWETQRERMKTTIQPELAGATDFYLAFQVATGMFGEYSPDRARAIILVTDGEPCNYASSRCVGPDYVRYYFTGQDDYLADFTDDNYRDEGFHTPDGLTSEIKRWVTAGTSINILMFHETGQVWDAVNDGWRTVAAENGGQYIGPDQVTELRAVAATFEGIIAPLIGIDRRVIVMERDNGVCQGEFYLEPYASSTTIVSATRPGSNQRAIIRNPQGDELLPQEGEFGDSRVRYRASGAVERYVITNPLPGRWTVEDPSGVCRVEASYEPITVNANVLPIEDVVPEIFPPYYLTSSAGYITVRLTDTYGESLVEYPEFALNICGRVSSSDIDAHDLVSQNDCLLAFSPVPDEEGSWRSDTPVPAPKQGVYSVDISGTVMSVDPEKEGQELPVFSAPSLVYGTTDPVSIQLNPVSPHSDAVLPLNDLSGEEQRDLPFEVELQVVTFEGAPQQINRVFPDFTEGLVQAVLTGNGVTRRIDLTTTVRDGTILWGQFATEDGLPDPEGTYLVQFEVVAAGLGSYNHENYLFNQSGPSEVSFTRRELEGLRLRTISPQPGAVMLANTIDAEGTIVGEPLPVMVRLVNQSDTSRQFANIFEGNLDNFVRATLRDPSGIPVEQITLEPSGDDGSEMAGVFNGDGTYIGSEGVYSIDFMLDNTVTFDQSRYAYLSPNSESVSFTRQVLHGVFPRLITPPLADSLPLNLVDGTGAAVPLPVEIVGALVDLEDTVYGAKNLAQFLPEDTSQFMRAILEGPDDLQDTIWLRLDANGYFRGSLRDNVAEVDPSGPYRIRLEVNPVAILLQDQGRYQLVDNATIDTSFDRFQVIGTQLQLVSVGGQAITETDQVVAVPLHLNAWDAFWHNVRPLPVEFQLIDTTTGRSVSWETVRRELPEGEELAIADVIKIAVGRADSADDVVLINLEEKAQDDGGFIIRGAIDTQANEVAEYRLSYGIESIYLDWNMTRNFSEFTEQQRSQILFQREITDLLRNPSFWDIVKVIAGVAIGAWLVVLLWINVIGRILDVTSMSGSMELVYSERGQPALTDTIVLSGWRFWPWRKGKKTGARVYRSGSVSEASRPGGASYTQRQYRVVKDTYECPVIEGRERIIGPLKAKHYRDS